MRVLLLALLPIRALSESAIVNFIRHGEKPKKGNGLTHDGERRAAYLSRCMAKSEASPALPHGPPTLLMAQDPVPGKSSRSHDLLKPLGEQLGMEVYTGCKKTQTNC